MSSGNTTVGTLDLGGASTQISFFKSDQVWPALVALTRLILLS